MNDSPAASVPVLELRSVHVTYKLPGPPWSRRPRRLEAVAGVDLTLQAGRTVAIVGESGCGKSTVAQAIVGLLPPSAGTVLVAGRDVTDRSRAAVAGLRRTVQMVFQDPYAALNPWMTVSQLISEAWRIHDGLVPRGQRDAEVGRLLGLVGLSQRHARMRPRQLSGGQRQRVCIARALAVRPRLIVCDEAVSALDVSTRAQIINLLCDIQAETGVSYVFVSHDVGAVSHMADEMAVMYLGQIVEYGPARELLAAPAHPYTQALMSAAPSVDDWRGGRPEEIVLSGDVPSPLAPPSGCRFRTRCFKTADICARTPPPLAADRAGHPVACHFAEADATFGAAR